MRTLKDLYIVFLLRVLQVPVMEKRFESVDRFINRVRTNISKNPVMVGFGIKSHENAQNIASNADGFIVGSALIDNIKQHYPNDGWQSELYSFVHSLKFGK
ncbi:MAG: tryptophan synthase subunit alpha [Gracilimonas sp.]|nr:tryptophan synthase subunit alpha [Gracilimonas sp.]